MKKPLEIPRMIVFSAMLVLIAACIHTSFDTSRNESIKDFLILMLLYILPLMFIASAALHGERKALSFISAFIALGTGLLIEYQYYAHPSPSNAFLIALGILIYWFSAIIAYFAFE